MSSYSEDLHSAALAYHRLPRPGKLEIQAIKPLANQRDLALAYSPGVAAACTEIANNPAEAASLTIRANLVAVVSNGTAVLGLGNIGPLAGKPVMEGKAVLFKKFAGIDVFDIEVDAREVDRLVDVVDLLALDAFVTGREPYTLDLAVPGLTHMVLVRSPHAHAEILAVDATRARAVPGVLAVFGPALDLVRVGAGLVRVFHVPDQQRVAVVAQPGHELVPHDPAQALAAHPLVDHEVTQEHPAGGAERPQHHEPARLAFVQQRQRDLTGLAAAGEGGELGPQVGREPVLEDPAHPGGPVRAEVVDWFQGVSSSVHRRAV